MIYYNKAWCKRNLGEFVVSRSLKKTKGNFLQDKNK